MTSSSRCVEAEALDALPADDPRASRSRRDLARVHRAMRSVSILQRAIASLRLASQPTRILELGAGDGTLLLRFARTLRPRWAGVELTLLDRADLVSMRTREEYRRLGWQAKFMRADALEWVRARHALQYDLCFANLFLHHFEAAPLASLLGTVAATSRAFVACEPRRSGLARMASRLVVLLGANGVTRGDAVKSVAAGFAEREVSAAWGAPAGDWSVAEYPAWPFTHCFTASRASARAPGVLHGF